MRGKRMEQARAALKYCLNNLDKNDRFAVINFATTVNKYTDQLQAASSDNLGQARKWVDGLEATGGTAINDALAAAMEMRTKDTGRTFTIVFFTDGRPTIGETNTDKILQNVAKHNTANTRIFTFGVGDDVNASMLDQLAEQSRAISTYVRETEDIEAKVSGLYAKISQPVLTNLKLAVGENIKLSEVYPPQLPDLFHGTQLVVLGRYDGNGHAAIKLTGSVGKEQREFVYEVNFPDKTAEEKPFVEDLWARRKVGYLLDQIRLNGEKEELVKEVVTLAKRYGITTPYTSYLIVPDAPTPVAALREKNKSGAEKPNVAFAPVPTSGPGFAPPALQPPAAGGIPGTASPKGAGGGQGAQMPVADFIKQVQKTPGEAGQFRYKLADEEMKRLEALGTKGGASYGANVDDAKRRWAAYNQAHSYFKRGDKDAVQAGRLGVDLSVESNNLRNQKQISQNAVRRVQNRNALDVGGVWIDEAYEASLKTVTVKAMSKAYFRILERHPLVKDVYALGNHLVWVTPSGTALVIDTTTGRTEMPDSEIDALFVAKK
jgi:Ca-activated chloride channel family protein